jgi:hypothetical protein
MLTNLNFFIFFIVSFIPATLTCSNNDQLCEEEIIGFRKLGVHRKKDFSIIVVSFQGQFNL